MTNEFDRVASSFSCRGIGGNDLMPLLVVVAVFLGVYFGGNLLKRLKRKEDYGKRNR